MYNFLWYNTGMIELTKKQKVDFFKSLVTKNYAEAAEASADHDDAGPGEDEPSPAEFGHTMVHSTADRIRQPVEETSPRRPARPTAPTPRCASPPRARC